MTLNKFLNSTPEGSPATLEPFYAWLLEEGYDQSLLRETFVAFMNRSADLGVEVLPPDEIGEMSPALRQIYVNRFMDRGTGEYKPNITGERPNPLRSEESQSTKIPRSSEESKSTKIPKSPAKEKSGTDLKAGAKSKSSVLVFALLGLVAIVLLVVASFTSAPSSVVDIKTRGGKGFPCKTLSGNKPELVCFVADDEYPSPPSDDVLKALSLGTLNDGGEGFKALSVYTFSGKLISRFKR